MVNHSEYISAKLCPKTQSPYYNKWQLFAHSSLMMPIPASQEALPDLQVVDFWSFFLGLYFWPLLYHRKKVWMQVTQVSSCPKCAQWDWDESAGKWASIFLGERGRPRKRKPGYISWPTFKLCVYYVPLLGFTTYYCSSRRKHQFWICTTTAASTMWFSRESIKVKDSLNVVAFIWKAEPGI